MCVRRGETEESFYVRNACKGLDVHGSFNDEDEFILRACHNGKQGHPILLSWHEKLAHTIRISTPTRLSFRAVLRLLRQCTTSWCAGQISIFDKRLCRHRRPRLPDVTTPSLSFAHVLQKNRAGEDSRGGATGHRCGDICVGVAAGAPR